MAKKIEEYKPKIKPKIRVKAKYFKVSPPKKKMAVKGNRVVREVLI